MLELSDVHAYYGDSYVLQGISLEIAKGTVVALLGRMGWGRQRWCDPSSDLHQLGEDKSCSMSRILPICLLTKLSVSR